MHMFILMNVLFSSNFYIMFMGLNFPKLIDDVASSLSSKGCGRDKVFDKPFKTFKFTNNNIENRIFFVEPS